MKNRTKYLVMAAALALPTVVVVGCRDNTAEDAGEKIDEGLEEVEDEIDDAVDDK
jgi:hypothetical protein